MTDPRKQAAVDWNATSFAVSDHDTVLRELSHAIKHIRQLLAYTDELEAEVARLAETPYAQTIRRADDAIHERDKRIGELEAERYNWKGMYMICNEREQRLLLIEEAAKKFVDSFEHNYCWIENGSEVTSDLFDALTEALRREQGGKSG